MLKNMVCRLSFHKFQKVQNPAVIFAVFLFYYSTCTTGSQRSFKRSNRAHEATRRPDIHQLAHLTIGERFSDLLNPPTKVKPTFKAALAVLQTRTSVITEFIRRLRDRATEQSDKADSLLDPTRAFNFADMSNKENRGSVQSKVRRRSLTCTIEEPRWEAPAFGRAPASSSPR